MSWTPVYEPLGEGLPIASPMDNSFVFTFEFPLPETHVPRMPPGLDSSYFENMAMLEDLMRSYESMPAPGPQTSGPQVAYDSLSSWGRQSQTRSSSLVERRQRSTRTRDRPCPVTSPRIVRPRPETVRIEHWLERIEQPAVRIEQPPTVRRTRAVDQSQSRTPRRNDESQSRLPRRIAAPTPVFDSPAERRVATTRTPTFDSPAGRRTATTRTPRVIRAVDSPAPTTWAMFERRPLAELDINQGSDCEYDEEEIAVRAAQAL